jgi:hypothetical protein
LALFLAPDGLFLKENEQSFFLRTEKMNHHGTGVKGKMDFEKSQAAGATLSVCPAVHPLLAINRCAGERLPRGYRAGFFCAERLSPAIG